jgi:competence protein ComEC
VLFGNLGVQQLSQLPSPGACAGLLLTLPILLRFAAVRWLAWAVVAFIGTAVYAQSQLDRRLAVDSGQLDIAVTGWIDEFPEAAPDRTVFSLRVTGGEAAILPNRLRLSWYDAPDGLAAGAAVSVVARLRAPRGLANPGGFDYERWLFTERIGATGYVRSGTVGTAVPPTLAQRWLAFRAGLARRIEANTRSKSGGALLVALTLGERNGFDDAQWLALRRTGTSHLVAISGLHVGLIAALSFWFAHAIGLRLPYLSRYALEIAAFVSAVAATGYAALAGFALPTQRALIMVVVALGILLGRRRTHLFCGLAGALIVVLVLDPLATMAASFWLSFGAVGLLLLTAGRGELRTGPLRRFAGTMRNLGAVAKLQLGITLGLAPLVAVYFGELSILSPIVNFVAIPFFSFVMVPLSLVATLSVALGAGDVGLAALAAQLGDLVWYALYAAASLEWSVVVVPPASIWFTTLATCAAVAAMPAHPLPARRLLWFVLVPIVAAGPERPLPGEADILILDVGHGLAALVETRDHSLLYDAGPLYRSGFDTGSEIVVPVLTRRGDDLDMLVISHSDSDHAGGAAAVHAAYPAAHVLKGPDVSMPAGETCATGQGWSWNEVSFEVLHPEAAFPDRGNDSSCVLKVTTSGGAILFTGDIERRGEYALAASSKLRSDVVIVPHHGSATSSSAAFVTAVRPAVAVVSAGHQNRWGFPRAEVRRRWEEAGATVIVTGDSGAVHIRLGTPTPRITVQRGGRRRYWDAESASIPGESGNAAL